MAGKKESGVTWHHTTVILQSDIYQQALGQGIDISDACNRALAGLTGIEYRRQQLEEVPPPPPVIIARDGSLPHAPGGERKATALKLHPVINADDPAAPVSVGLAKNQPVKKDLPVPVPAPVAAPQKKPDVPGAAVKKPVVPKVRGASPKKRSKGDTLKAFFSSKIGRTDDPDAAVSKDELYDLFTRFCHEHRITPVPERKAVTIALKNQFALTEKQVNGIPSWTGILLK